MGILNRLFRSNKIHVTFIDSSSEKVFGQSSMNLDQLPEDFSIETTMHLDANDWIVEEATPLMMIGFAGLFFNRLRGFFIRENPSFTYTLRILLALR